MSLSCHFHTNFALRPAALRNLEQSGYGIHAIAPGASSLGLALTGRVMFNEEGAWQDTPELATLHDIKPFFFARSCLGKVPHRAPFSQLNKGDRHNHKDRP